MKLTKRSKHKSGYWTLEKCQEEALKYNTRTEWANKSMSSYTKANLQGWLDQCSTHMVQGRKPDDYWNFERCKEDALKYTVKNKWRRLSVGAATSALKHGWFEECTKHMISPIKPMGYWTKEKCIEEAAKYIDKDSWVKNNPTSYNVANKHKWMQECAAHMIVKKLPSGYWTKKRCLESSRKFNRLTDWRENFRGAVNSALSNGWYGECTAHMNKKKKNK